MGGGVKLGTGGLKCFDTDQLSQDLPWLILVFSELSVLKKRKSHWSGDKRL